MSEPEPQQYQQQFIDLGNGWKKLVECEQEWLARPDIWAFTLLDEPTRSRKQWLYYSQLLPWHLEQMGCEYARQATALLALGDSSWLRDPAKDGREYAAQALLSPGVLAILRKARHGHLKCEDTEFCAARGFLKDCSYLLRGIYTWAEWRNRLDELWMWYICGHRDGGRGRPGIYRQHESRSQWLLRDLLGNPYQPVTLGPLPAGERNDAALALAHAIDAAGTYERCPELADMLERAGCDHGELLAHLRGPGPHGRGCWAVDLVLGPA